VRFTSVTEWELKEAMESYEAARPGLGAKFLAEARAATKLIEAHPLAWTPLSLRTRRIRLHHFPFGLFYQVRPDEILVLAVMDMRRDPARWEQNLRTTTARLPAKGATMARSVP
jgi:hypothetical protein